MKRVQKAVLSRPNLVNKTCACALLQSPACCLDDIVIFQVDWHLRCYPFRYEKNFGSQGERAKTCKIWYYMEDTERPGQK